MKTRSIRPAILSVALVLLFFAVASSQNPGETAAQTKARAKVLVDAQKFTEALPLYEQLVKQMPSDVEVHTNLGFCLLAQAHNVDDPATRRQLRVRARESFVRAKDYGDTSMFVLGLIEGIPADGSGGNGFSDNAEANRLMSKGEGFFTSGKPDEALKAYGEALAIDPRCYYAALFSGDVHFKNNRLDEAEKWYQKAIAIDPFIETAHRYSATPLMRTGKADKARDRYVEAFILAPYSRLALNGIIQWGEATNTQLGHPRLDIPKTAVGADGKQNTSININPLADDGSMAWIAYSATREEWRSGKFAKAFPTEKAYRHSVAEEADALRSVVSMAKTLKAKATNEQFKLIERMDKDGVLESFVLMAIPDEGIARDHAQYVRANRDKMRKYVIEYVIAKK
jgi:tetratricopeptide (TPR) repeat protein